LISGRLKFLNFILKWTVRPVLSRVSSKNPARLRPWLDKPLEWVFRPRRGVQISEAKISNLDVPVMYIENGESPNGTLLYLHGGAYVFGSARTHRKLVSHICGLSRLKGISVNYRLAPENPFPAAIDDAFAVYMSLITQGVKNIIIAGDSAGGGLALALLGKILAADVEKPAGLVAFSPWTDFTLSSVSMSENDRSEYLLPPRQIRQAREFVAPKDHKNPLVSPIFANFKNAPPVLIFVGSGEVLLDDATGIADNIRDSGALVTLSIYKSTPHVWVMGHGFLPEANAAMAETAAFIKQVLQS